MNELALFAGAGGSILCGKLLGWRTVCAVEINEYCRKVLMQRQDDGILESFPVWDDIKTFRGERWRGIVDLVYGGFPCTDLSVAGKGAGIEGEYSGLWREMARVIREVEPRHVFMENSPAITFRGLGTVLGDMAAMGFDGKWGVLGAHHAGFPHKRDRFWGLFTHPKRHEQPRQEPCLREAGRVGWEWKPMERDRDWKAALSAFRGMDDELARSVDRTDATRNGWVPACAALAWRTLA